MVRAADFCVIWKKEENNKIMKERRPSRVMITASLAIILGLLTCIHMVFIFNSYYSPEMNFWKYIYSLRRVTFMFFSGLTGFILGIFLIRVRKMRINLFVFLTLIWLLIVFPLTIYYYLSLAVK